MQGSQRFKELNVSDKFILLPDSPSILTHEVLMKTKRVQGVLNPPDGSGSAANAISLMNGRFDFVRPETEVLQLSR